MKIFKFLLRVSILLLGLYSWIFLINALVVKLLS